MEHFEIDCENRKVPEDFKRRLLVYMLWARDVDWQAIENENIAKLQILEKGDNCLVSAPDHTMGAIEFPVQALVKEGR